LILEYFILDAFNKFNASFQTEETKVHLLQSAAQNLLKTVLKNVVKASLLNFVSMGIINLLLACNRLSPDQVMVGEAYQNLLDRLNQEGQRLSNQYTTIVWHSMISLRKKFVTNFLSKTNFLVN